MGENICYGFSRAELNHLRLLLHSARELIQASASLDPTHANRLIRNVDRLEADIRSSPCDLSSFWGFVAEATLALHHPAEDIQLIAREVQKLVATVWCVQVRAFGLSGDAPVRLLGQEA